MIYYILFFMASCICYIIQKNDRIKNLNILLGIIVILLLSLIGGLRDLSIGTDVQIYGKAFFDLACKYNVFKNYVSILNSKSELFYLLLNFIVSRFSNDINVFLFISQIIVNTLVFIIIYKNKEYCPMWMAMLVYCTIYYCRNYNFLRQSIALAVVFYGFKYLRTKNIIKYFICVIIAGLFHSSAYIAFIFYLINYIMTFKSIKAQIIFSYLMIFFSLFIVLYTVDFMNILNNLNLINDRYYRYTIRYLQANTRFYYKETIFRMIFILWYILNMKKINELDKQNKFLGLMIILDCIFLQFRNTLQYADRIAYYFGYSHILLIPQFANIIKNKKQKFWVNLIIVVILIIYFYYEFAIYKFGEVYPYKSSILGI